MPSPPVPDEPARRRGPRPRNEDTRELILAAARGEFAERGYEGATLRGIARSAGVDPRLVHHYFEGKEAVLREALALPMRFRDVFAEVVAGDLGALGERIVTTFLRVWDSPDGRERLAALVTGTMTSVEAMTLFRQFFYAEIHRRIVAVIAAHDVDDPELRASLVASHLLGLALARYLVRVEPVASADPQDLVPFVGPTLQRYLFDPIP